MIVSIVEDNRFGHPSPEILERYAAYGLPALHTDQHRTIKFSADGEQPRVAMARRI